MPETESKDVQLKSKDNRVSVNVVQLPDDVQSQSTDDPIPSDVSVDIYSKSTDEPAPYDLSGCGMNRLRSICRGVWSVLHPIMVLTGLVILACLLRESRLNRGDITREMSLQRAEFSAMKSSMVEMQDKFHQNLEKWGDLEDVTRELVQVQRDLETSQADLGNMLNLANTFNKMNGVIMNVSSSMADKLDGMMKSELFKTADELTPMRKELSNINTKLSDLPAMKEKLDTLSNHTAILEGIKSSLEDMRSENDDLKTDVAEIVKEIGNLEGTVTSELVKAADKMDTMRNDLSNIDTKLSDLPAIKEKFDTLSNDTAMLEGIENSLGDMKSENDALKINVAAILNEIGELDGTVTSELVKTADKLDTVSNDLGNIDTKLSDLPAIKEKLDTLSNDAAMLEGIENSFEDMKSENDALKVNVAAILNGIGNLDGTVTSELLKSGNKLDTIHNDLSNVDASLTNLSDMKGMLDTLSDGTAQLGGIKNTLQDIKSDCAALRSDLVNRLNKIVAASLGNGRNGSSTHEKGSSSILFILCCTLIASFYV